MRQSAISIFEMGAFVIYGDRLMLDSSDGLNQMPMGMYPNEQGGFSIPGVKFRSLEKVSPDDISTSHQDLDSH